MLLKSDVRKYIDHKLSTKKWTLGVYGISEYIDFNFKEIEWLDEVLLIDFVSK